MECIFGRHSTHLLFTVILLFFGQAALRAQEHVEPDEQDRLNIESGFFGTRFNYQGEYFGWGRAAEVISVHPEAHDLFWKSRSQSVWADVTGVMGGFGLGWTAVDLIYNRSVQSWPLAIISVLIVPSFILSSSSSANLTEAIHLFNNRHGIPEQAPGSYLYFGPTTHGLGWALKF
jgi:hypothetical protein